MFYRTELIYNEGLTVLDKKYFGATTLGYIIPPGSKKVSNTNLMLKFLLPNEVELNRAIDDIRLNSILFASKTIRCTRKIFSNP